MGGGNSTAVDRPLLFYCPRLPPPFPPDPARPPPPLLSLSVQSVYWPENRLSAMYFNTQRQELVTGATRLDLWRPQLQGESTPLPPPELAGPGGENQRFRRPLVQAVVSQSFRRESVRAGGLDPLYPRSPAPPHPLPRAHPLPPTSHSLLVTLDDASAMKVWSVESGTSVVGFTADEVRGPV